MTIANSRNPVEIISDEGVPLAYIVDGEWRAPETSFLTPGNLGLQMGMIVYGAGKEITPHVHLPVVREVHGTSECIVVREGRCIITIYNSQREFVASRELVQGTIILLLGGGHGFKMLEDTILFEVKQGPYVGDADKERF